MKQPLRTRRRLAVLTAWFLLCLMGLVALWVSSRTGPHDWDYFRNGYVYHLNSNKGRLHIAVQPVSLGPALPGMTAHSLPGVLIVRGVIPGLRFVRVMIYYWILAGISGLLAVASGVLWWRYALPPGVCQTCGYNLTGNVSGVCPECGTNV